MIIVGNIVTLENGKEYLLLEECTKDGVRYLYAVRTDKDENPTDEYLIFEAIINGDKELYDELIDEFSNIVADKILDADIEDDEEEAE